MTNALGFYANRTSHNDWITRALAPFFPRYRVLRELEREPEHLRMVFRNLILTRDHKLLFLRNQKAACTQVTQILYSYSTHGKFYRGNVHRANRGIIAARYKWPLIREVMAAEKPFFFTFVRNPEKRAVSAYMNFFHDRENLARRNHDAALRKFGYDPAGEMERNFDAFLDYVDHSLKTDRMRTTTHWRPQVDNIGGSHFTFDLIGQVENFERDIRRIFAAAGVSQALDERVLWQRFNRSSSGALVPTPAQRARIRDIYAEDYAAFGY